MTYPGEPPAEPPSIPQQPPWPPQGQYPPPPYPPPGGTPPRRPWPARHKILTALGGVIMLLAAAGVIGAIAGGSHSASPAARTAAATPGFTPATQYYDTPTPAPAQTGPDMLSLGQAETVGNASTSTTEATVTVRSATVTTRPADAYGEAPANGYFVVVRVSAAADPSYTGGFDINEFDFYALEGGSHYDPGDGNAYSALTNGQSNSDLTATLAAGETSTGWISFDVPGPHGQIVYAPNLDGQPIAEWEY